MAAKRCSDCGTNWPNVSKYGRCPRCETRTSTLSGAEPLGLKEAERQAAHALFERHYQEHERQRVRSGRLSPEELGRREAQEILALEQLPVLDDRPAA